MVSIFGTSSVLRQELDSLYVGVITDLTKLPVEANSRSLCQENLCGDEDVDVYNAAWTRRSIQTFR